MKIKDTIDRIPGGLMLVPLLLGAVCKTFAPDAAGYFKGFTQGIMTGVIPILAVWFFCMGASIKLSSTGTVLRKSGTIVLTKFIAAGIITLIASLVLPPEGIQTGFFAGLSVLAIVCAMDMTNGGLYASLMQTYGTKEEAGALYPSEVNRRIFASRVVNWRDGDRRRQDRRCGTGAAMADASQ
jgi:2-keto-3-deoxygluconate permease